jgi:hypothetical protein
MKPLFMKTHESTSVDAVEPVEGKHYSYSPKTQQARWSEIASSMSTTQTFSGNHSLSDDSHADSE